MKVQNFAAGAGFVAAPTAGMVGATPAFAGEVSVSLCSASLSGQAAHIVTHRGGS